MYQIKLNSEDSRRLKKIIRQMMIQKDMSAQDLSEKTGYSRQAIYNYLSNNRQNRFIAAAICDVLEITVGANK